MPATGKSKSSIFSSIGKWLNKLWHIDSLNSVQTFTGFPAGLVVKNPVSYQCRRRRRLKFDLWARKTPWRRNWQPTPVFLPGEFHGQRSLVGYSLWGHKELDTAEHEIYRP